MSPYCPECGAETGSGDNFCQECGTELGGDRVVPDSGGQAVDPTDDDSQVVDPADDEGQAVDPKPADVDGSPGEGDGGVMRWVWLFVRGGTICLLVLLALAALSSGGIASGIVFGLAAVVTSAALRRRLESASGFAPGALLVAGIVVVGMVSGMALLPPDFGDDPGTTTDGSADGGGGAGGESSANTPTPTATPTATPNPTSHGVGDTFEVGSGGQSIRYTVTGVQTRDTVGSGFTAEEADGVFVVVSVEMTNTADESTTISSNLFTLVDGQDREYETDSDALLAAEDNIVFEQLDPGVTKSGVLIYDVPTDQTGRQLQIAPAGTFSTADSHTVDLE